MTTNPFADFARWCEKKEYSPNTVREQTNKLSHIFAMYGCQFFIHLPRMTKQTRVLVVTETPLLKTDPLVLALWDAGVPHHDTHFIALAPLPYNVLSAKGVDMRHFANSYIRPLCRYLDSLGHAFIILVDSEGAEMEDAWSEATGNKFREQSGEKVSHQIRTLTQLPKNGTFVTTKVCDIPLSRIPAKSGLIKSDSSKQSPVVCSTTIILSGIPKKSYFITKHVVDSFPFKVSTDMLLTRSQVCAGTTFFNGGVSLHTECSGPLVVHCDPYLRKGLCVRYKKEIPTVMSLFLIASRTALANTNWHYTQNKLVWVGTRVWFKCVATFINIGVMSCLGAAILGVLPIMDIDVVVDMVATETGVVHHGLGEVLRGLQKMIVDKWFEPNILYSHKARVELKRNGVERALLIPTYTPQSATLIATYISALGKRGGWDVTSSVGKFNRDAPTARAMEILQDLYAEAKDAPEDAD